MTTTRKTAALLAAAWLATLVQVSALQTITLGPLASRVRTEQTN
jgi:hypothetical protein